MQKRAVFLDRDGVINRSDGKPPNTPEELVLLPKVSEAISRLNAAGFLVFVVTNQGWSRSWLHDQKELGQDP